MVLRFLLALLLAQELVMAQHPNRIDSLHTIPLVVEFVRSIGPEYIHAGAKPPYHADSIPAFKKMIDSFHIQPFEKVDLDGNGFTDLLFNGDEHGMSSGNGPPLSIVILSYGRDSFLVKNLSFTVFNQYFAARVLHFGDGPALQTLQAHWDDGGREWKTDTLVWKLNTLLERTPPVKHHIERIDYTVRFSQMPGRDLALKITADSVQLTKELFEGFDGLNNGGVFLAKLDRVTELRLYNLLEQMDFARLKNNYDVTYSDASTGMLDITYDGGKHKTIVDHGLEGTYGLAELQNLLHDLQTTQHWVEATPLVTRNIDSIHTDVEVLGLVRHLSDSKLDFLPETDVNALQDFRQRTITFGAPAWQKADFDGNGYTDLLFNGFQNENGQSILSSLVVLSYANDSLVVCPLTSGDAFFAAKSIHFGGKDYINTRLLHGIKDESQEKGYRLREWTDTLTATNGQLTELPAKHPQHIQKLTKCTSEHFDKIEFTRDTIWWYKNVGAVMPMVDSHALYFTVDTAACARLLAFANSINLDRLDPTRERDYNEDFPFYNTWTFERADGRQLKLSSNDVTGSYSLRALDDLAGTFTRTDIAWQLFRPKVDVICNCDRIDSLRTDEQILSFIHGLNASYYQAAAYSPPRHQPRLDSFGYKKYQKLDLDNNGLTDLLFNGYDSSTNRRLSLLILAFDKDSFLVKELPKEYHNTFFAAKAIHIEGNTFLQTQTELYGKQTWDDIAHLQTRIDTLKWEYTGLVERNESPWHKIDTLRYMLSAGLGGSDLQLTIIGDSLTLEKNCEMGRPETPIDSGGIFTAKMNFVTSEHLYSVLNATGFEKLNKAYTFPVYDLGASDFEIWYDNGKRKTIYDYGSMGRYGLSSLEDLLLSLQKKLHWKRIAPGGPEYMLIHDLYEDPF